MAEQEKPKTTEVLRNLPSEQSAHARPVVQASHLPTMEAAAQVKTVQRNPRLPLMGAGGLHPVGGSGQMTPVPDHMPASHGAPSDKPQEPKVHLASPAQGGAEGYVRLEVQMANGKLSITGAKSVPGPLSIPSAVVHGYVYEAVLGDQQVSMGSLPDVGVQRSFANRDVPGREGKHGFTNLSEFTFFVRIPSHYISSANLPNLNLVLHKVEDAPEQITTLTPLGQHPQVKSVEVGRINGIKLESLPEAARSQIQEIVEANETLR